MSREGTPRELLEDLEELDRFIRSRLYGRYKSEIGRLREREDVNKLYTGDKSLLRDGRPNIEYRLGIARGLHCGTMIFEDIRRTLVSELKRSRKASKEQ